MYKMEPLTIETFNPDMIKAINSEQKRSGEINYTPVKFEYNRGKIPPLIIDGSSNYLDLRIPEEISTHYP